MEIARRYLMTARDMLELFDNKTGTEANNVRPFI